MTNTSKPSVKSEAMTDCGIDEVDGRYGKFYCHPEVDLISDSMRLYGEWAQNEIDTILEFITQGDVVLDIGACIGTHSVAFAQAVAPGGRVVAFEPSSRNFQLLTKNSRVAGRELIEVEKKAVTSRTGTAKIINVDGNAGAGRLEINADDSDNNVQTVTLDELGYKRVDFIKLDIEGAEADAIAGAKDTIAACQPIIYAEVNNLDAAVKCHLAMQRHSYFCYGDASEAYNHQNHFSTAEDIFDGGVECGLLFIPTVRFEGLTSKIEARKLFRIETADDLGALLLRKPQYIAEYLEGIIPSQSAKQIEARDSEFKQQINLQFAELVSLRSKCSVLERQLDEHKRATEILGRKISFRNRNEKKLSDSIIHLLNGSNKQNTFIKNEIENYTSLLHSFEHHIDKIFYILSKYQIIHNFSIKLSRRVRSWPFNIIFGLRKSNRKIARFLYKSKSFSEEEVAPLIQILNNHVTDLRASTAQSEKNLRERAEFVAKLLQRIDVKQSDILGSFHSMSRGDSALVLDGPIVDLLKSTKEIGVSTKSYDLCSEKFDYGFYLRNNGAVIQGDQDPLVHYLTVGWKENRDPAPWFDTSYYLSTYNEVVASGMNPFEYYLTKGRASGHLPAHPGGHPALMLGTSSPESPVSYQDPLKTKLEVDDLATALSNALQSRGNGLLLSISHSNWLEAVGGTEVCIQIEAETCREREIVHLSIFPMLQPWSLAAPSSPNEVTEVGILLNGEFLGSTEYGTLQSSIEKIVKSASSIDATVHHLLGHQPEKIANIISATERSEARMYLHDYFTACGQWNLLRNQIAYCGAPSPESGACGICRHGKTRAQHLERIRSFFDKIDITVVSPSSAALDVWKDATGGFNARQIVLPHMTMEPIARENELTLRTDRPIRIGFAGAAKFHKGWMEFEKIVEHFKEDKNFEFHYFGIAVQPISAIYHNINVTASNRHAMTKAIRDTDIDFIFHFAQWPETFSFTAFESLASGAFIITNPVSGNVAATVREGGRGVIVESVEHAIQFLESASGAQMLTVRRRDAARFEYRTQYSDMAVSLDYGASRS